MRAKEIPLDVLMQPKTTKSEEIIPFTMTYNPNSPKVFLIIKQSFDSFQYSKTMFNIFTRKKLVKSLRQAPDLQKKLHRSKFELEQQNEKVFLYLLKASLDLFN